MKFKKPKFLPELHLTIERWKYYQPLDCYISTEGRIKDKEGNIQSVCSKNNYLYYRGKAVHRMVMELYNPIAGWANLTVDHKNHNTRDNSLRNLAWCEAAENQAMAAKDYEENKPKEDEPKKVAEEFVYLNKVKLPIETARALMKTSPGLAANKIDSVIDKIKISPRSEFSYGNWKIKGPEAP